MKRSCRLLLSLAASVLTLGMAQAQTASVRIVHGLPGRDAAPTGDPALPVDVQVNNAVCLLRGFTFGAVAGPFTLAAGTYNVKIYAANTLNPCTGTALLDMSVALGVSENVSLVAHLTEAGTATLTKFGNNLIPTHENEARLIVHHLAAAPAVDIVVRQDRTFGRVLLDLEDVTNTPGKNQALEDIRAGTADIQLFPARTRPGRWFNVNPLASRTVQLSPRLVYLVYAVGSVSAGTLDLIVEPVGGLPGVTVLR